MTDLSIIFVNWNSTEYLRQCLESVYAHTDGINFEVIVVDNASPQDDASTLKESFPDIHLILSKENVGFAGGNNIGFAQSTGEYVLFLNPDCKLLDPAINTMMRHLKSLPDAGIVSCRLLNANLSTEPESIQPYPTILNRIFDFGFLTGIWPFRSLGGRGALLSDSLDPAVVDVVPGTCIMMRRDTFERAGKFSVDYFMYAEDVDLCYQVRRLGLKTYFLPDAAVIHYGGSSSKQRGGSSWTAVMQAKAILKFSEKTHGRFYGFAYRLSVLAVAICRLAILTALAPIVCVSSGLQNYRYSFSKWLALLKWSVGIVR
jgi:GT2 family glycosyltransferase